MKHHLTLGPLHKAILLCAWDALPPASHMAHFLPHFYQVSAQMSLQKSFPV